MRDPYPSNITGEKVQRHVIKWEVNLSHVALAVVALVVLWKFSGVLGSSEDSGEDLGVDGADGVVDGGMDESDSSSPW